MVSVTGIRLTIPGGTTYESTLVEAATKVAIRKSLPEESIRELTDGVRRAIAAINTTEPDEIEMRVDTGEGVLLTTLTGRNPVVPLGAAAVDRFRTALTPRAEDVGVDLVGVRIWFALALP